eukprot:gene14795-biopygen14215
MRCDTMRCDAVRCDAGRRAVPQQISYSRCRVSPQTLDGQMSLGKLCKSDSLTRNAFPTNPLPFRPGGRVGGREGPLPRSHNAFPGILKCWSSCALVQKLSCPRVAGIEPVVHTPALGLAEHGLRTAGRLLSPSISSDTTPDFRGLGKSALSLGHAGPLDMPLPGSLSICPQQ